MRRWRTAAAIAVIGLSLTGCGSSSEQAGGPKKLRIPTGAGGIGFLPLLVMQRDKLIEQFAAENGGQVPQIEWIDLGGPSVMNDALLSGSVDFIAAGPPAFLTLWDATHDSAQVKGVAAMSSLPMYLNVRADHLKSLDDVREGDKIAVTAIKVSIPAIIMQMYAEKKYGRDQATRFDKFTVPMTHPDGVIAMLSDSGAVNAHFTSPPFHQVERQNPKIRTILTSDDVMGGSTTFTMISTTTRFHDENPELVVAFHKALEEASRRIAANPQAAADLLLESQSGGITRDELVAMLQDPAMKFTTTPENVMKYAEFMAGLGSLKNRPASWKDLFFSEIHTLPGS